MSAPSLNRMWQNINIGMYWYISFFFKKKKKNEKSQANHLEGCGQFCNTMISMHSQLEIIVLIYQVGHLIEHRLN